MVSHWTPGKQGRLAQESGHLSVTLFLGLGNGGETRCKAEVWWPGRVTCLAGVVRVRAGWGWGGSGGSESGPVRSPSAENSASERE